VAGIRLARAARIAADESGRGFVVRTASGARLLPVERFISNPDTFLDLLDGSRDLGGIARAAGIGLDDARALVDELNRLRLLGDSAGAVPVIVDRGRFLGEPADATASLGRIPVLLVGAGDFGLALLRDLLISGRCTVALVDPVPIRPVDVGPFYGPDEIGQDKAEVVWSCLGPRARAIVRPIRSGELQAGSIEAVLAPILATVSAVVCDGGQPMDVLRGVSESCRRAGVPLVPVEIADDRSCVGPVLRASGPEPGGGCFVCAQYHRAERDPFEAALVRDRDRRPARSPRDRPPCDASALAAVSKLAMLALSDAAHADAPPRARASAQIRIDHTRHVVALDPVSPQPRCRRCFPIADRDLRERRHDAERRWRLAFHGEPAPPADLVRLWPRLLALVGEDNGMFRTPSVPTSEHRQRLWGLCRARGARPEVNAIANAHRVVVQRPSVADGRAISMATEGLDFESAAAAGALAMLEGLERLFALDGADPQRFVMRRHAEVAADALDPRQFPLFAPEQYSSPGFALRPFDADAIIPWMWGIALGDDRPVLVPADFVHASVSPARIYRATSNGAACHSSFHHAVLNGMCETIERDALMIVWLNRLSMPRVELDADGADPDSVRAGWDALGLDCELVDITTDLDVPVLLGVLRDRLNPDLLLVDPVASLSPGAALRKLYKELVQFSQPYLLDPSHFRRQATQSLDGDLVEDFPDHLAFYQSREKHAHAAFLTAAPARRALGEGPRWRPDLAPREAIDELVARLGRRGHEAIAVDCTVPLLESLGLSAVKVLIPGLQPLNAGHRYRALGGTRALTAPRRMGMADRDRTREELNPWPHPFW
jgi:ribosomal protein S12 methylthiotransferase accessory factor